LMLVEEGSLRPKPYELMELLPTSDLWIVHVTSNP
jgi:hypothetical protein